MPNLHWRGTPAERLDRFSVPEPNSGCVLWLGAMHGDGYGHLRVAGRVQKAHRVAFELARGPVAEDRQIDHLCRNRACVNPAHMEIVTQEENVRRGISPPAQNARLNACRQCGGPLVPAHRARRRRLCAPCTKAYLARYYRANKEKWHA